MIDAIDRYGIGAGASQLLVGHSRPHQKLEKKLASFLSRDAALVFTSGYQANLAVASVLVDTNTVILQDKRNHASLIDAARLSNGHLVRYRHNDLRHLERLLEKHKNNNLMVMTEGVFSMDGDYAPLLEVSDLCVKYKALLMVDDAHGLGVLGESGAGLLEMLGLNQKQVPLLVGTFGKSFGASGAFVAGNALHIEAFIQKARTYIYTTAMPPSLAVVITQAIDLVVGGNDLRQQIEVLIRHYKEKMMQHGLTTSESDTMIQPFIVGDIVKTTALGDRLYKNKILAAVIRPPTVPKGTSRLRISLTAAHNKEHVDRLVATISNSLK